MNKKVLLAIPIAGKSKRFAEYGFETHKAFLEINNSYILKEIIINFPRDLYVPCIVCTFKQFDEYRKYFDDLLNNFPDLIVKKIEEHDLGPTYSIRQIDIEGNRPLLIHYCDFLVETNFKKLFDDLHNGFFLAPFFRGFHPASFGNTTFCYLKLDPNYFLISLKEKESFTEDKINEPCSTGIYGFPTFTDFMNLADKLLSDPSSWRQSESYTSLCMNIAVENFYKVYCSEVKNFICLGTPNDYIEYLFWENTFKKYSSSKNNQKSYRAHIITAAGEGSRFKKCDYRVPKIFLKFDEKFLIEHAIRSIKSSSTSIISLTKYEDNFDRLFLNKEFKTFFLNTTPFGQLRTLNEYLKEIRQSDDFFVSSADYNFQFSDEEFSMLSDKYNPDVIIFTTKWNEFAFEDPINYGFVECDQEGRVVQIVEKPKFDLSSNILSSLLIGTFWFKSSNIINCIMDLENPNSEAYIGSSLNKNLKNLKVYKLDVDYWLSFGTPKEFQLAEYWFKYLSRKKYFEFS